MDRRAFLSRTGALIGASFGGLTLSGTATAGGVAYDWSSESDAAAFGDRLDAQLAAIRAQSTPFLDERARASGLPAGWIPDVCASLTMAAAFRDLPHAGQQHPELQRRMHTEAHRLGQHLLRAARTLRALSRDRRLALRTALRDDPHVQGWLAERFRARAPRETEGERLDQLDEALGHAVWRLRNQDPDLLIDEVIGHVERAAASVGLAPDEWDAAIEDSGVGEAEGGDGGDGLPVRYVPRSRKTARMGLVLLGIGAGLLVVGIGVFFLTAGVVVLVVAMVQFLVESADTAPMSAPSPVAAAPPDVPGAPIRTDGRYEGMQGGIALALRFGADGLVVGTWSTDGAPTIRSGQWAWTGQQLRFDLAGAGIDLAFVATPRADVLDTTWTAGGETGHTAFRFAPQGPTGQ